MSFYGRHRFAILLAVMALVMIARMVTIDNPRSEILVDLFVATVTTAAILSISEERRFRAATLVLGIPAVVFLLGSHLFPGDLGRSTLLVGRVWTSVFLMFTVALIIRIILTERHVTADTIIGAFCGYLLMGVIWTEAYCAVEVASPGSFSVPSADEGKLTEPDRRRQLLEYFSFMTLTTTGFGDVTPVSTLARVLAIFEAICGQFYLAVLVAGLVSIRVASVTPATKRPHHE